MRLGPCIANVGDCFSSPADGNKQRPLVAESAKPARSLFVKGLNQTCRVCVLDSEAAHVSSRLRTSLSSATTKPTYQNAPDTAAGCARSAPR
jgi:hypothetical protein